MGLIFEAWIKYCKGGKSNIFDALLLSYNHTSCYFYFYFLFLNQTTMLKDIHFAAFKLWMSRFRVPSRSSACLHVVLLWEDLIESIYIYIYMIQIKL